MYRNLLTMAALAAAAGWSAQASAQYRVAPPAPASPTQHIAVTPTPGQPVGPLPAAVPYAPAAAPLSVVNGPTGAPVMVTQPRVIPPTRGAVTAISPQPAYAAPAMAAPVPAYPVTGIVNQPYQALPQNTQVYMPTYYYYYYQQPVAYQPAVAAPMPMMPVASYYQPFPMTGSGLGYNGASGPMFNARGEMGHVRWPYYSYRRPWYWAGQPSFNVTIPGPVW